MSNALITIGIRKFYIASDVDYEDLESILGLYRNKAMNIVKLYYKVEEVTLTDRKLTAHINYTYSKGMWTREQTIGYSF